jgi:hypothetical protein
MEALISFGRGPLFRFAVALAILGILRHATLSVVGFVQTRNRVGDKRLRLGTVLKDTFVRLNPLKYFRKSRWAYSILSVTFHVGLVLVPIFFLGHIRLWNRGLGLGWPALPGSVSDPLTILTAVTAVLLLAGRATSATSRAISRTQDWLLPPAIALAFLSGFLIAHPRYFPGWLSLDAVMLVHVWLGDLLLLATPFTKIAHCALLPFSQLAAEMAWRMVPGAGNDVLKTLGNEGQPI